MTVSIKKFLIVEEPIRLLGGTVTVFRNIMRPQFDNLLDTKRSVRLMQEKKTGIWYGWNANDAIHTDVIDELELDQRHLEVIGNKPDKSHIYDCINCPITVHKTGPNRYVIECDEWPDRVRTLFEVASMDKKFDKLFVGKEVGYNPHNGSKPTQFHIVEDGGAMGGGAPTNSVGSGAIAGAGVGLNGEPGVSRKKKKTSPVIKPILRRRPTIAESVMRIDGQLIFVNPNLVQIENLSKNAHIIRVMRDTHKGIWYAWNGSLTTHFEVAKELDNPQYLECRFQIEVNRGGHDIVYRIFSDTIPKFKLDREYKDAMADPKFVRMFPTKPIISWSQLKEDTHFAGNKTFVVSPEYYHKCIMGKRRYSQYKEYVGDDETGTMIREYGLKNIGKPIVLKNSQTGAMLFLKYGKY